MEDKKKSLTVLGRLSLFAATIIWGTAFVIQKNALDSLTPFWLLSMRFLGAGVILLPFSVKDLKKADRKTALMGVILGATLFLAYATQTYGLEYTTPGKNAFLTAAYCILVPFFNWFITHRRPDWFNIYAAVLAVVGIGLVSLTGDFTVSLGDGLTLICAVFYALQIIEADKALEDKCPFMAITVIQTAVCGVFCLIAGIITEPVPVFSSLGKEAWLCMAYLCILSTASTQFFQIFGQKHTPPSQASLIMSLESVFGVIASLLFYPDEVMTARIAVGFVLIFVAVIISETKLNFLRKPAK